MSIKQILASAIQPEVIAQEPGSLDLLSLEDMDMMSNIHEAEMAVIESETAISITETAITGLEGLSDAVAIYQENGGMDAQAAALLSASVETVMAPFGGGPQEMPSQEAYEGDGGRVAATEFAMEGLKSTIKTMWDAVVSFFKRAKDAILKWFKANFFRLEKVKAAAAKLATMAKDAKGKAKGDKIKIDSPEVMYTDGKFVGGEVKSISMIFDMATVAVTPSKAGEDLVKALMDGKVSTKEEATAFATEVADAVDGMIKEAEKGKAVDSKDDRFTTKDAKVYMASEALPGNAFIANVVEAGKVPSTVFANPQKDKKLKGSEEPGLESGDIEKLCNAISSAAGDLIDMKDELGKMEKRMGEIEKAGKKLVGEVKDESGAATKTAVKDAMSMISAIGRNLRNPYFDMAKYATTLLRSSYSYAKSSYGNLEEAK